MPGELWQPVRYVRAPVRCRWGHVIPAGVPGRTTGTRGTKAFYCHALRAWECMPCRAESTRVELAREAEAKRPRPVVSCLACGYSRPDTIATDVPLFGLAHCDGCELGSPGIHRRCPLCGYVEHRSHPARAPESCHVRTPAPLAKTQPRGSCEADPPGNGSPRPKSSGASVSQGAPGGAAARPAT